MKATVKGFTVLIIMLAAIGLCLLTIIFYMSFMKIYRRRGSIADVIPENAMAWRTKV